MKNYFIPMRKGRIEELKTFQSYETKFRQTLGLLYRIEDEQHDYFLAKLKRLHSKEGYDFVFLSDNDVNEEICFLEFPDIRPELNRYHLLMSKVHHDVFDPHGQCHDLSDEEVTELTSLKKRLFGDRNDMDDVTLEKYSWDRLIEKTIKTLEDKS